MILLQIRVVSKASGRSIRAIVARYASGLNLGTAEAFVLYRADRSNDPRVLGHPVFRDGGRTLLKNFISKELRQNQIRPQLTLSDTLDLSTPLQVIM
jgi:hypothetical protein